MDGTQPLCTSLMGLLSFASQKRQKKMLWIIKVYLYVSGIRKFHKSQIVSHFGLAHVCN